MSCIRPRDHVWVELRGGAREKCIKCRTVFPCRHDCEHFDCMIERGDKLPEWASAPSALDRMMAELSKTPDAVTGDIELTQEQVDALLEPDS